MRAALILSWAIAVASNPMPNYGDLKPTLDGDTECMNRFKFYAQHAAAAYCNAQGRTAGETVRCPGVCDAVMANNATILSVFEGSWTGIAGYLSADDARRELVLSVRGSHNVRNFLDDIFFRKRACDFAPGCKLHAGFADAWAGIAVAATAALHEAQRAYPAYRVVVTGHSLGGAVAALAAAYFRRDGLVCDLYTFGAPRVGNHVFARFADEQPAAATSSFRLTHVDDPVPRLPPLFLGFRHAATEYWLSNGGATKDQYWPADVRICPGIDNVQCNAGTFGFDVLAHLYYLTGTAECAPMLIKWKRDEPSKNEEVKQRLDKWSQMDQTLMTGGKQ